MDKVSYMTWPATESTYLLMSQCPGEAADQMAPICLFNLHVIGSHQSVLLLLPLTVVCAAVNLFAFSLSINALHLTLRLIAALQCILSSA